MKKIEIHECLSAEGEWDDYSIHSDPHSSDLRLESEYTETDCDWYTDRASRQLDRLRADMPINTPRWKRSELCHDHGSDSDGRIPVHTCVALKLEDLGQCIVGRIIMNGALRTVLILFPAHRKVEFDVLRTAPFVPVQVRERVRTKVRATITDLHGDVAFIIMPRRTVKREPSSLREYQLLLLRAGLRWAELRDRVGCTIDCLAS